MTTSMVPVLRALWTTSSTLWSLTPAPHPTHTTARESISALPLPANDHLDGCQVNFLSVTRATCTLINEDLVKKDGNVNSELMVVIVENGSEVSP
ncbi:hypothetical protein FGIG_03445 [Fasciola gigantica]|uniref:Secreted protein n=1 Tax=Fasciola gigantica TaxID=46835 RepID=A0A504Z2H4_FASGI|nr:hypothetical protein FGIG_03445 [Fasciola gigantica]